MAKARTGELRLAKREKTYKGRVRWLETGDEWFDLCTNDATLARKRLDDWVATGHPPSQAGLSTFRDEAERLMREQESKARNEGDVKSVKDRRHRLRAFAFPVLGHLRVMDIVPPNVSSVLAGMEGQRRVIIEAARKRGAETVATERGLSPAAVARWLRADDRGELGPLLLDTKSHMLTDVSRILALLVLEGALPTNAAAGVSLPDDVEFDARPFVVLNDSEIQRLFRRGFNTPLMMACLLAREFGAQRTSDLLGADWEHYNLVEWKALIKRPKTEEQGSAKFRKRRKRRKTLVYERTWIVIPEPVRAPLLAYWQSLGSPVSGPLFPAQRGRNAGKRKSSRGNSWAQPLRDLLWEERIVRPLPGWETAEGEERRKFCMLQVDTDYSRKAVFHSLRRAGVTALREAGVPIHLAMLICGHTSETVHAGYNDMSQAIEIPAGSSSFAPAPAAPPPPPPAAAPIDTSMVLAALGQLLAGAINPGPGSMGPSAQVIDPGIPESFQRRAQSDSNTRPTAPEARGDHLGSRKDADLAPVVGASGRPDEAPLTQKLGQSIAPLDAVRQAAAAAVAAGNWALADQLRALLDPPAGVARLDDARKRRR